MSVAAVPLVEVAKGQKFNIETMGISSSQE